MSFSNFCSVMWNKFKSWGTNKIKTFLLGLIGIKGILILLAIIAVIVVVTSIATMIAGAASEDEPEAGLSSATGTSWEQFIRYVETKEGGTNDGVYYFVEDDSYGVPTVGHGLALYNDGSGHKAELALYGYDTVALVNEYKSNGYVDSDVGHKICYTAKVLKVHADEIFSNHIYDKYQKIITDYGSYALKEYQYYALTDVQYRRGTLGPYKGDPGFSDQYSSLWSDSDNKYGEYDESTEPFSTDTLYNFFWNQGHSLPGVRTRKKEQWVLFKYGYYIPLNEYWQESTIFSGDLYNDDGSVNEEKIEELQKSFESTYNLVEGNLSGNNIGGRYDSTACKKVTGTYLGYSGNTQETVYADADDGVAYLGNNNIGIYQCTWWANGRASEYLGRKFEVHGNGGEIYANSAGKYNRGSEPKPNSLVSYTGSTYGHVAYVEAVDNVNGYYYISHAGSGNSWFGIEKVKIGEAPFSGYTIIGFVYLDEPI